MAINRADQNFPETESTVIPYDTPVITLFRDHGMWLASYAGPDAEVIKHLFGTNVIPTAFAADFEASRVYDAISKLNPTYLVLLEALEPENFQETGRA